MPEGLKIVVSADATEAQNALKDFVTNAQTAGNRINSSLSSAFEDLKKSGLVSILTVQAAMKELKDIISITSDPSDLKKLNQAFAFLADEEKKLKRTGLDSHLEGVNRSTQRVASSSLSLAKVINLFPEEVSHVTHAFDGLIEAYEQIRSKTETSGQAFAQLAKSFVGPLGIGIALSVGASLLETFGVKLFETSEEAKKAAEKLKELIKPIEEISSEAAAGTAGEAAKVNALVTVIQDQTKSYEERNRALLQLKEINKNYFGDLTLEASKLGEVKKAADEYTKAIIQQAVIKGFQDEIGKVSVELSKQTNEFHKASEEVVKFEKVLNKAKAANKDVLVGGQGVGGTSDLREATSNFGKAKAKSEEAAGAVIKLRNQFTQLSAAITEATEESLKFKPLEDTGTKTENSVNKTIELAKKLAAFFNRNTQFSVHFEVDPNDSEAETLRKAKEFIQKTKSFFEKGSSEFGTFLFKPLIAVDFKSKFTKESLLQFKKETETEFTKTMSQLQHDLEKEIDKLVLTNPVLKLQRDIQRAAQQRKNIQDELATGVGLKIEGINTPDSPLSKIQKDAVKAANSINDLLTPAFQGLFSAILAGENPLKSFFESLGQSVVQLLQKLIAAAIQAAILSAIFPGGIGGVKGFGGFFKNILGFASGGIVSGPVLAMVGEGIGTSRSNPEVVAPLDQLKGILAGISGNNQLQPIVIGGRLRGNDFKLLANRTDRKGRRLGAA